MPPAKRQKRSASAEPARSPPMHDEADIAPAAKTDKDEDLLGDDFDPALLDEEEVPGGSEGGSAQKPGYAGGFNAMKQFNGQYYTGMAIGGSHKWNYDPGVWTETKKEPDLWTIDYRVDKHRSHNAPKGSGAPEGTEYEWLIVARQSVKKLDANTYSTHLHGSKYKLNHKSVGASGWNITKVKQLREREVDLLKDAIGRIEGLPPVLASEKIKTKEVAKGQKTLDGMFKSSPVKSSPAKAEPSTADAGAKRKR